MSDLKFESRTSTERQPAEYANKALLEDRWLEAHGPLSNAHLTPSLISHSDLIEKSTLPSTPKASNDLFSSTIDCFKSHPQEMIGSAVVGVVGTVALMRSPAFWAATSELGLATRRFIAERMGEPPTDWSFSPKLRWYKLPDQTFTALRDNYIYTGLADGTIKKEYLGISSAAHIEKETMFPRGGGISTEWGNGLRQDRVGGKVETFFPDGRKIAMNEGYLKAELPNGTIFEQTPDLNITITKQNGVVLRRDLNGNSSMSMPGGTHLHIAQHGGRQLFLNNADGSFKGAYVTQSGNTHWLEWTMEGCNSVYKPVEGRLPFSQRNPFEHEIKKVIPKVWK